MADRSTSSNRGRSRRGRTTDTGSIHEQLGAILSRLTALEQNGQPSACADTPTSALRAIAANDVAIPASLPSEPPESVASTSMPTDVTERFIGALHALTKVRSTHYYISSFDPRLHDIDSWCDEVEKARDINKWDDNECLSRIANCLKGDARSWLDDWITSDRSWTNFKAEFKPLCTRRVDIAQILFDVMSTNSDRYSTYAEYARRSILRLNVVKGLSDELTTAIVIRGIADPQIRATATNAHLVTKDLVQFLSIYTKPNAKSTSNSAKSFQSKNNDRNLRKRGYNNNRTTSEVKCFSCESVGHLARTCPKRSKENTLNDSGKAGSSCTFCKKAGHDFANCFIRKRSEERNKNNVNFCRELKGVSVDSDVTTAVIQGVPTDVLIDSGSRVSLVSESVLKHFKCSRLPTSQVLRGIGDQNVESTSYVTLIIEFPEIALEVDFFVVPNACINVPVLIGTDVLNRDGVAYVRTNNAHCITRISNADSGRKNVMHINSNQLTTVNSPLEGDDRQKLLKIVNEFREHLIVGTASSTVTTGSMNIELTSNTPVCYRPYRLSTDEKSKVREITRDLLDKGIIRESTSPYASPIILVKKRDGSDRMCVDYRALNANTVKDKYPLPLIEDHIDRLGKSSYFSCLDMATGFHQISVSEESVPKTAFVTPEGHFEYLKMPFGLANAPVVYQRIITNTLKSLIDGGKVLCFIDDVIVMASSMPEALQNLYEVLVVLTSAGFSVNMKKSTFVATEVEYLGRIISGGQVRPSQRKIKALIDSPVPTNVKQVRQLLGLAGYFRRYIANYASKTACIAGLTRKGVSFHWGKDQEIARKYLIDCLTSEPVLAIFDPSLPAELHTDASSVGYGAVLIQVHEGGQRRVVAYFSKSTQGAEARYHSYELETLAVVKALQHFRHYLLGIHFKIITDCNALKMTERKKDLLPRVARWWIYMQDFNFNIEYRKGIMMQHADFLSRNPVDVYRITRPKNWAQIAQSADEETLALIDKVNNNELDPTHYVVLNDLLYYKYTPTGEESRLLCYIPKGHRLSLLRIFHDQHDHVNADKTIDLILRHFWFPGLRAFVKKYIRHCLTCLSSKRVPRAPYQPISSWSKPDVPFDTVHADVLGVLPVSNSHKYILLIIDAFSKYCLFYALKRQDSDELQRAFTNAISLFGVPNVIVCDRGRMFESASFKEWVSQMGSRIHFVTPGMHSENGQVERYCRTLLNMLRIEATNGDGEWSDVLWRMQLVLNCTKQKTTQTSPLQLLMGVEAMTPVIRNLVRDVAIDDARSNREALRELQRQRATELLDQNRRKQDERVNKNRKDALSFQLDDKVFVIKDAQVTGKLDPGMRGPYRVTQVLPHGRYALQLLGGSYGKTTQAAAEHMVAWRGEWTPETCTAFFQTEDEAHEDSSACGQASTAPFRLAEDGQGPPVPQTSSSSDHDGVGTTPCQERPC